MFSPFSCFTYFLWDYQAIFACFLGEKLFNFMPYIERFMLPTMNMTRDAAMNLMHGVDNIVVQRSSKRPQRSVNIPGCTVSGNFTEEFGVDGAIFASVMSSY
jgi:hypothetical protein